MARKIYFCPICKNQLRTGKPDECRRCGPIDASDGPDLKVKVERVVSVKVLRPAITRSLSALIVEFPGLKRVTLTFGNDDEVTYSRIME